MNRNQKTLKIALAALCVAALSAGTFRANDWATSGVGGNSGNLSQAQIDAAWEQFPKFQPGGDHAPMFVVNWVVIRAMNDPEARADVAARLASLLSEEGTTPDAKIYICQQLYRIGTPAQVPAVKPFLLDPATADSARLFFERVEGDAATVALREAFDALDGRARVGVMNSLSIRRDGASVPKFIALTRDERPETSRAAWRALGNIANGDVADFLIRELEAAQVEKPALESAAVRTVILMKAENPGDARIAKIFQLLAQPQRGGAARQAALVFFAKPETWAKSGDPVAQKLAARRFQPDPNAAEFQDLSNEALILAIADPNQTAKRLAHIDTLVARRCYNAIDPMLRLAKSGDDRAFADAISGLRRLCDPDDTDLRRMVAFYRDMTDPARRDAAERAVAFIAAKSKDGTGAALVLKFTSDFPEVEVLPLLGRLGAPDLAPRLEAGLTSEEPALRQAAFTALCNWPNAQFADQLWALARSEASAENQSQALRAYIRVVTIPSDVPPADTLAALQRAFAAAKLPADRDLAIQRAGAVRTLETVQWLATFLDDEALNQTACRSIVELAHHRFLRQPNKAAFEPILRRVEAVSKDREIVVRAEKARMGM